MLQYCEEKTCQIPRLHEIYNTIFSESNNNLFIDCGAYNGVHSSNTIQLAKTDWSGILVEPVEEHFNQLVQNYSDLFPNEILTFNNSSFKTGRSYLSNKFELYKVAVSDIDGYSNMTLADTLSTLSEEKMEYFKTCSWAKDKVKDSSVIKTKTCKIDTLLNLSILYNKFKKIDVLSIDIEGFEDKIITNEFIGKYMPKMIIIENCYRQKEYHLFKDFIYKAKKLEKLIEAWGYELHFLDYLNQVWVR